MTTKHPIILSAVGLLFCSLISCQKDDPEKENKANLIGSWVATELTYSECETEDSNGTDELSCTSQNCLRYIFTSDSLDLYVIESTVEGVLRGDSGPFRVSESSLTLCEEDEDVVTCDLVYRLDVSASSLTLTTESEDSGCVETIVLVKEESDEEEEEG